MKSGLVTSPRLGFGAYGCTNTLRVACSFATILSNTRFSGFAGGLPTCKQ
jgi:hypothetical protein